MLTKYRFKIEGNIRPEGCFPIRIDDVFIEFVLEEQQIVAIEVIEKTQVKDIPRITQKAGKIDTIFTGDRAHKHIKRLKLAEGLLSFFGLREIIFDKYDVEWIPQNEEEKKLLHINNFSFGYKDVDDHNDSIPFYLIASSFIACYQNDNYEAAMSFYRKGKIDMAAQNYIEAFYDFYFVLESVFAKGKTKNDAIEKQFLSSERLMNSINKSKLQDASSLRRIAKETNRSFDYIASQNREIVRHIVKTRGFLHHHNEKHPDSWSPDFQKDFHLDAVFIMNVAHNVLWEKVTEYIYNKDVESTFMKSAIVHERA